MLQKLYLAGTVCTDYEPFFKLLQEQRIFSLESFWNGKDLKKAFDKYDGFQIFLDSGAYSWHSFNTGKGIAIDEKKEREYLDNYIEFILEYKDRLYAYANLDVVGDPVKTQKNQEYMEKAGLLPVAVFHYNPRQRDYKVQAEEFSYLKVMAKKYPYIALGGGASEGITGPKYMKNFGDPVFSVLEELFGDDIPKVHGFGITSIPLMTRYPWHSVDSTSWVKTAAYGGIIIPKYNAKINDFRYDRSPTSVSVSTISRHKAKGENSHFDMISTQAEIDRVLVYLEEKNLNVKLMEEDYRERQLANIYFFEDFMKTMKNKDTKKYRRTSSTFF